MITFLTTAHVSLCVLLVLLVLIQSGKGAEISASFGGSSQTVFGSSGGANFFTRFTASVAALFMVTSIALTYYGSQSRKSIFDSQTNTGELAPKAPESANTSKSPAPSQPKSNSDKKPVNSKK